MYEEYFKKPHIFFHLEMRGGKNKIASGMRLIKNIIEYTIMLNPEHAIYRIKSETTPAIYSVEIFNFNYNTIQSTCTCPDIVAALCKHRAAVLLHLAKQLKDGVKEGKQKFEPASKPVTPQSFEPTIDARVFPFSDIDMDAALRLVGNRMINQANNLLNSNIITAWLERKGEVLFNQNTYSNNFTGSLKLIDGEIVPLCSCNGPVSKICQHALAALHLVFKQQGPKVFTEGKSLSDYKNDFKIKYGIAENENIDKLVNVSQHYGKTLVTKLNKSLYSVEDLSKFNSFQNKQSPSFQHLKPKENEVIKKLQVMMAYALEIKNDTPFNNAIVTSFITQKPLKLAGNNVLIGKKYDTSDSAKFECSDINEPDDFKNYIANVEPKILFKFIKEYNLTESKVQSIDRYKVNDFTSENYRLVQEKIHESYLHILPAMQEYQGGIFIAEEDFAGRSSRLIITNSLLKYQPILVEMQFSIVERDNDIIIRPVLVSGDIEYPFDIMTEFGFWFITFAGTTTISLFKNFHHANAYRELKNIPQMVIKKPLFDEFVINVLPNILKYFKVTVDPKLMAKNKVNSILTPSPKLYLKELNGSLLIIPVFAYTIGNNVIETEWSDGTLLVDPIKPKPVLYERNKEVETDLFEYVRSLHQNFEKNKYQAFFHLPAKEVMTNQWFLEAVSKLNEKGFEVLGQAQLTTLKYNLNKPRLKFGESSGQDWFDLSVSVQFGDLNVALKEIKKALYNRENYITLSDGTIGTLPAEWVNKYAAIFQTGEVKNTGIKLSKMHFNLLTDLTSEIDNEALKNEINLKKEKLLNFKQIKKIKLPKTVKANLRDYQVEGYNWLNFLDEFGWGGCLADDMGLGKTLQAITLLAKQKEKKKNQTSLVIVPTTLIFNWINEIEKFCVGMDVYVHRGFQRSDNLEAAFKHDVILTTYGTIRSDIEIFKNHSYNYVILDESQAIKNPAAQVSKAVKLLKANNRLVMTGTPVENNTFDLYSQLDFVNPGLLGSQEYFRETYATPIDKYKDEVKAGQLRQLIYPFILKRNKETVAKELPEKTEMVLYCEMGKEQRKVYDTFKNLYRKRIEESINANGLAKSGFLILEGLTKLRQICDSPQLLNDDATYTNESAKLEEIEREITENAGHHKIIIFSQFLKMLDLIKTSLEKHNIPYTYLDGKTKDREDKVNTFQQDENCRVFLISLKAGGVGLNLTEADYVYLVDPWWNPAVEKQAIDRAHRIGQNKKVFAYRMICKDTIEEKIIALQEKKKFVADSLINTESGFMKKLSKDDISSLFI